MNVLHSRIDAALNAHFEYEVIYVCDGCDNRSENVVRQLHEKDPDHVQPYFFIKNQGQHNAIRYGLSKVTGDYAITMDEDLQHSPDDIIKLAEKQKERNYDIVYAVFPKPDIKGIRFWISKLLRNLLVVLIPHLHKRYSPFRMIRQEICKKVASHNSSFVFIDDYLCRITSSIGEVNIKHHPRLDGSSSYTLQRIMRLGFHLFIAYSGFGKWLIRIGVVTISLVFVAILIEFIFENGFIITILNDSLLKPTAFTGTFLLVIGALVYLLNNHFKRRNFRQAELK